MLLSLGDFLQAINTILACGVALYLSRALLRALSSPLRSIPGPFLARFTRHWELLQVTLGHFEGVNIALHRKYGTIVRLAPNRYSLSDPACIKPIYGMGSGFSKSSFYTPFGSLDKHSDVFSETSNAQHAASRRKIASMYSLTSLLDYEPVVDNTNVEFIHQLESFAQSGDAFDLMTWMQFYAFDVIGEITFGRSFGMLEAGCDKDNILHAVDFATIKYAAKVGLIPEFHPWFMWLSNTFGLGNPLRPVQDFVTTRAKVRQESDSSRPDFFTRSFGLLQQGKMEQHDLRNIIGQNVAAGSDTTGISAAAIIYFLVQNPNCMRRLLDEIDTAELPDPVPFRSAQKLEYLQAVIKEALRMHPAVGNILARTVPEGGAVLAGVYFPAGSVVGVNAWVLHRDRQIWGEDADSFKPERWLVSKDQYNKLDANFFAFGAGSRTCIGKNISLLELNKLLPQILQRFEFLPGQNGAWKTWSGWFVKQEYQIKVRERKGESAVS